jgi:uncharacterized Zn-binding protein involved in type VI secretion
MPKAARVTDRHKRIASPAEYIDLLKGKDNTAATEAVLTGSHNVFINGRPAVRVGDECETGGTFIATGASNVFINGRSVARMTDLTCHETTLVTGSHNVFIGAPTVPRKSLGLRAEDLCNAFVTDE